MYTVIRRYEGVRDADEVVRRATSEFGPILAEREGFQGYYVLDAGDGVVASISVFETQQAAEDSTLAASSWVAERLAELIPNPPQVTAGMATGVAAALPA
jgi:heme-degrading monooxygenase HmoA